MPYCPKCKNEYREGFSVCAECNVELVDELPAEGNENETEFYMNYMMQNEMEPESEEENENTCQNKEEERPEWKHAYVDSASKAQENRSSAWTFLVVGAVGLIAMILVITGVIPLSFNPNTQFLIYGVMCALFVLFLVIGVVSFRNSIRFEDKAKCEKTLTEEMQAFCKKNLTGESIDKMLFPDPLEELAEEEKYFRRTTYIKTTLSDKFLNLEDDFLDDFVDKMIDEIYC